MTLHASCLCGHVQVQAHQRPFKIGYCHCGMCRRQSGAPFTCFSIFAAQDIGFASPPSLYTSSAEAQRGFCPQCGASISWHGQAWGQDIIAIATGLFTNAETLIPTEHWFVGSALPWVRLDDDLPKSHSL